MARPAYEFGKSKNGDYHTMCPMCRQTWHVQELYMEQERQITRAVKKLVSVALKQPVPLPDMSEICRDLVGALGGKKEFVKRWAQSIMDTKSGTKTSLDAHSAVAKVIQATASQRSRDQELSQLSPEELESAILGFMVKMADEPDEPDPSQLETELLLETTENRSCADVA